MGTFSNNRMKQNFTETGKFPVITAFLLSSERIIGDFWLDFSEPTKTESNENVSFLFVSGDVEPDNLEQESFWE